MHLGVQQDNNERFYLFFLIPNDYFHSMTFLTPSPLHVVIAVTVCITYVRILWAVHHSIYSRFIFEGLFPRRHVMVTFSAVAD